MPLLRVALEIVKCKQYIWFGNKSNNEGVADNIYALKVVSPKGVDAALPEDYLAEIDELLPL